MANEHTGHRDRVRKKFLENGFDGFEPHEVLEMCLFYAIPRKDTNALAHRLLDRYLTVVRVCATHLLTSLCVNFHFRSLARFF